MNPEAKNLQAISKALDHHAKRCDGQVIEIRMSGYEVERLDWPTIRGIPVKADENMGTGRFRLVCDVEHSPSAPVGSGRKVAA